MQGIPAFMIVANGNEKAPIGYYDNLDDLRSDHRNYFVCWGDKNGLYVRLLTPAELAERKREQRHR